jgi:hypothetical protein
LRKTSKAAGLEQRRGLATAFGAGEKERQTTSRRAENLGKTAKFDLRH